MERNVDVWAKYNLSINKSRRNLTKGNNKGGKVFFFFSFKLLCFVSFLTKLNDLTVEEGHSDFILMLRQIANEENDLKFHFKAENSLFASLKQLPRLISLLCNVITL